MDTEILVAGECLVDFIPSHRGRLSTVDQFRKRPGGAPANVAVRLAGLGTPPLLWTRLGCGPFGRVLEQTLEEHNLPSEFIIRDETAKSTLAFVSQSSDDDRFSFYREETADTRFRPGVVPDETLAAISWVSVGGVCLTADPSREAMLDLMGRARDHDCRTVFDPNARPELWDGGFPEAFDEACSHAAVVKATPEDLREASIDGSPEDQLEAVVNRGPDTAVLTLGEDGVIAQTTQSSPWGTRHAEHDGYTVDAVDPTGAGDAFTAGLIRAMADGRSLADSLAFANAVAAVVTTSDGAMSASVDLDRVTRLVE